MLNELIMILNQSGLASVFEMRREDDYTVENKPYVSYRVKSNLYRIRAFEIWDKNKKIFRIFHSDQIDASLKNSLNEIKGLDKSANSYSDYIGDDLEQLCVEIKSILENPSIIEECKKQCVYSKTSRFEGLDLPDVDISDEVVRGREFTWKEIIKIYEDNSPDNKLKEILSQKGIYLQRSKNGASRYVGSAYGEEGIIGRWMKHLNSNGDASYLNLFVLENGYNEITFNVIEFCNEEGIIQRERMWKDILGSINKGPYDGIRLNNN